MDTEILPFLVVLVSPVLGQMSDQNQEIRHKASSCFSKLVSLMPLEVKTLQLIDISEMDNNIFRV